MRIFHMKSFMAFNGKYLIGNLISNQIFTVGIMNENLKTKNIEVKTRKSIIVFSSFLLFRK